MTLAGRVNTALNLAVFVGAFGLQWGIGAVVDALVIGGRTRAAAFEPRCWPCWCCRHWRLPGFGACAQLRLP